MPPADLMADRLCRLRVADEFRDESYLRRSKDETGRELKQEEARVEHVLYARAGCSRVVAAARHNMSTFDDESCGELLGKYGRLAAFLSLCDLL